MAGTIIVDRIESDASYASSINVAAQVTFSNTVSFSSTANVTGNMTVTGNVSVAALTATDVVTFPAGTAALPSITTAGDPDTGIYFPSTNNVAFTTASTERMRISPSGNVLIGTTTTQTGAVLAVTGGIQGTITSGTVVTASGTSIDFTALPSWVKRITVIFQGVSTNGSSAYLVRLGTSGGVVTSGYVSSGNQLNPASSSASSTAGFNFVIDNAGYICTGNIVFNNISSNTWVASYTLSLTGVATGSAVGGGQIALGGTLDRVRITTVNGTDTFDAGSINIMYEG